MKKILINESACIGCNLCEVHCRVAHSKSKDPIKAYKKESPRPEVRLRVENRGPLSFSVRCRQCQEPSCVYACLTGALRKNTDTGMVTLDEEKCIGCWTCVLACPFGAIRIDQHKGKIAKCDLCQGEDTPACVANCPNEALVYADYSSSKE